MNKTVFFELNEIDKIAKVLLKNFNSKTILFYGEMGVGKTTLISALIKGLGCKEKVTSPTFSIVNEHTIQDDIVYHFDFYRIGNISEVLDIGIEDYLYSGHWNFIEWPDKITALLPYEINTLNLKHDKENARTLKLSVYEEKLK